MHAEIRAAMACANNIHPEYDFLKMALLVISLSATTIKPIEAPTYIGAFFHNDRIRKPIQSMTISIADLFFFTVFLL